MIIDAHCHAGLGDGLTGPWDTRAPLGDYLRRADRAGIGRTSCSRPSIPTTGWLTGCSPASSTRDGPVHRLRDGPSGRDPAGSALIDTAVNAYGFEGIKVHRHDARISREVCESAGRTGSRFSTT